MRKGWTETTLGEIAVLTMGRTPSRSDKTFWTEDLTYPFCTIADMDGKMIFPKREGVTIKAIQEGKAKIAPIGTLLMSFKLTIGRMGFAGQDIFPNEAIVSITPNSKIALDMFLYYLLGFQDLTAGSGRAIKGETLNSKSLSAIPILLPPLTEQKRIVDVLNSVDAYIDALQQQADSARAARNAVLHEMLTSVGDNWTETTLGEIAKWGSGGTPKSENPSYYDGDIPWCVIGDLTEGEVSVTEKCISQEGLHNSSAKMVEPGAVLIAMYGASIGRTGIVAVPMATNQAIAFAYVDETKVVNLFLLIYLQIQKQKFIDAGQGAAQPNISQTVLKDWPILLPSLKEQKRIVEIVSSIDEVIQSTEQAVFDAKALRSGLLSDLLSGNHEIPASYDSLLGAA